MEAGGEIIWSPDPGRVEAMTAVLCHRVSYDEGAKRQVTDSPRLNGQMTKPTGRPARRKAGVQGREGGREREEKGKIERRLSFDTLFFVILDKMGLM
ncbi:hypothetical protein PBY51_018679 [Eleginops maclovinus]|uniref:Uncharacterized protein n=1 Tax=Eleginops maclovinus TaxID=56733 RepID=A0AAN7YAF1_ELEMC|nr:hypothetical protein PBY51_018679 [Eleginops maclovinus]